MTNFSCTIFDTPVVSQYVRTSVSEFSYVNIRMPVQGGGERGGGGVGGQNRITATAISSEEGVSLWGVLLALIG